MLSFDQINVYLRNIVNFFCEQTQSVASIESGKDYLSIDEIKEVIKNHPGVLTCFGKDEKIDCYRYKINEEEEIIEINLNFDGKKSDMVMVIHVVQEDGNLTGGIVDVKVP